MVYDIVEYLLKEAAGPQGGEIDRQIHHQMEYLKVVFDSEEGYILRGPGSDKHPTFLGVFYGKDQIVRPKIEKALQVYTQVSKSAFNLRVLEAIQQLQKWRIPVTSLWLSMKKARKMEYPYTGSTFLGTPVMYHYSDEEFVASISMGRLVALPEDPIKNVEDFIDGGKYA